VASDAKKWTAVSGAIVGGLAASACCVLPLVLLWVGISGAWIANLTALAEYHLWILSGALLMLGLSYRLIFSNSKNKCDDGKICTKPLPQRFVKNAFWIAAVLIIIAAAFPYAVSLYYGV
jgi:mercuric ion transport protein|tara:strand:+ start:4669 stop:5028 length:360 start_codon:yes stop_codon:yes gene_type:complete